MNVSRRLKIIYPYEGFNCLLLPFFDTLFLRDSLLRGELVFGRERDPFLERLVKGKRVSAIQGYFWEFYRNGGGEN